MLTYSGHRLSRYRFRIRECIYARSQLRQQIVLSPHHRAHRWHRTLVFIGLGLSAVIPVIHVLALKGLQQTRIEMSLDLVVSGGACYIVGAVL